jgi:hypothetical protein
LILACDLVNAAIGGYVAALVAGRSELKHALAFGAVLTVAGIIALVFSAGNEPLWYQLARTCFALPSTTIGGSLRAHQQERKIRLV